LKRALDDVRVLHLADVLFQGSWRPVNAWAVSGGDRLVLVDTGMVETTPAIDAEWPARLRPWPELGEVTAVVNTHLHFDHCGGNRLFPGVPIYVQRTEHEAVAEPDYVVQWVHAPGLRYELVDGDAEILPGISVLFTPGHSPGHVCLYDLDDRVLFAGDQLLPDISPNVGLHPQSTPDPLDDFVASLRRLVALQPALVLPAHGRPYRDAAGRAAYLEEHHRRRKDQILEITSGREMTAWEVALEVWGERRQVYERRLALQEGLAHLQALAVEGRLEKLATSERVTWRPALPTRA
jgi:N-acyl homoserine lactone hydrolase